jgi:hypothetical protein
MLRSRAGLAPGAVPVLFGDDAWQEANPGARLAFFLVTLAAALAFNSFVALLFSSTTGMVIVAVLALMTAEWLIEAKRFFRMGPEEALWIVGIEALVFRILALFAGGEPQKATVLIGAGFLVAGIRLLNPFFVDLAAVCFCWYAKALAHSWNAAACAAFAIAAAAMALLLREWRRPSHEAILEWLAVTMPIVGYVALTADRVVTTVRPSGYWKASPIMAFAFALIAVGSFLLGIRVRLRAALLVSMFSLGVVLFECRDLVTAPIEWKLIAVGGALLAASIVAERLLRDRDRGITSKKLDRSTEMRLLEAVGGLALAGTAPASAVAGDSSLTPGGGSFGGGGASSNF